MPCVLLLLLTMLSKLMRMTNTTMHCSNLQFVPANCPVPSSSAAGADDKSVARVGALW